jgi:hypothetical protein
MTRSLSVAASPGLIASLAEQFEALGAYELRDLRASELAAPWPHAALLDAAACDAPALGRRLRASGFTGMIVAIGDAFPEADAVLPRPFRFADLLALLDAPPPAAPGPSSVNGRLTEKETAILHRLAQAKGATISKTALLADVWGYGPNVSTRTLETHIHRLRRKIEVDPRRPMKLLTEEGGYRLADSE